jgi:hypothetical protein
MTVQPLQLQSLRLNFLLPIVYLLTLRMTCSVCIQYASSDIDKKADFVTGSSNFKLESVISHETSEQHLKSVGKQSVKENSTVNSATRYSTSPTIMGTISISSIWVVDRQERCLNIPFITSSYV